MLNLDQVTDGANAAGSLDPIRTQYKNSTWAYLFRVSTLPDPVAVHVHWIGDGVAPLNPPEWVRPAVTTACRNLLHVYAEAKRQLCLGSPSYLMGVSMEINQNELEHLNVHLCSSEAVYWVACLERERTAPDFGKSIICFDRNENGTPDLFEMLPPGHSMHDAKEVLRLWTEKPGEFR